MCSGYLLYEPSAPPCSCLSLLLTQWVGSSEAVTNLPLLPFKKKKKKLTLKQEGMQI